MCLFRQLFCNESSNGTDRKSPLAERLVLKELENALAFRLHNADQLDGKLKELLSFASLILSIVITLQTSIGNKAPGILYVLCLVLVLLLYAVLVYVTIKALRPTTYHAPIPADWNELAERYFGQTEEEALQVLISTYLYTLEKNKEPVGRKARAVHLSSILLVAIVVVLLLMTIVGTNWSFNSYSPISPLLTPPP